MGSIRRRRQQQQPNETVSSSKRTPTPDSQPEEWRLEAAIVALLTLADEDNRLICPPFRVLPTPDEFPLYYKHIKNPIDLRKIAGNIKCGKYTTWQELEADINLMCKNAQVFNEPNSKIHMDANRILQHFQSRSSELANARRFSQRVITRNTEMIEELLRSTPSEIDEYSEDSEEDEDSEKSDDPKWKLYWTIRNYEVINGIPLCQNFMELPSKRSYPDYYDEIEHPISLYMINKKLKRGKYPNLAALVKDLLLTFDNACSYNIDGSEIFNAAVRLHKLTLDTSEELNSSLPFLKSENIDDTVELDANPSSLKRRKLIHVGDPSTSTSNDERSELKGTIKEATMKFDDGIMQQSADSNSTESNIPKNQSVTKERPKKGRKSIDEMRENFSKLLMDVWLDVRNLKMGNRILSDPFLYLPSDKKFPDYYKTIKKPMSMTCIKNKILDSMYRNSDEMIEDVKLMCQNARTYNRPGSQIVTDSTIIESVASGCIHSKTGGVIVNYPMRRSDKGWIEQSSTEKSPYKKTTKKKLMASESTCYDNEMASTSKSSAPAIKIISVENELETNTTISQFHPHPHHPGVYIATCAQQNSSNFSSTISENQQTHSSIMNLVDKLKNRDHLGKIQRQMYALLEATLLFKGDDDRLLSESFIKLPSKEEYKEYYHIIKCPIDIDRVVNKLIAQQYDCWRSFFSDLYLVFENACKFNDPDSDIYKDAVVLLRGIINMREQLFDKSYNGSNGDQNLSVQVKVKQILMQLFEIVVNYKDHQDRCLFETLNELQQNRQHPKSLSSGHTFSMEQIRENIAKGLYRRLDRFQEDLFALFSQAREIVPIDSQKFYDLVELQRHFIDKRDLLCKNLLSSPALIYTQSLLDEELLEVRKSKEREKRERHRLQKVNSVGIEPSENGEENPQLDITVDDGIDIVLENNFHHTTNHVDEHCEKLQEESAESDNSKQENDIKIISNNVCNNDTDKFILDIHREEVLDRRQPHEKLANDKPVEFIGHEIDNIYYQQMEHNGKFYRLGDGIFVYNENKPHCDIMRIDRLWKTRSGEKMFSGCRFVRPSEVKHEPSKMFYKQELIALKTMDMVGQMINIQGPCTILTQKQYEQYRPTEIPECDVFVVEQKVLGPAVFDNKGVKVPLTWNNCSIIATKGILVEQQDEFDQQHEMDLDNSRPLRKLRNYNLLREVTEDEIYYFKQSLIMEKVLSPLVMNPNSSDHTLSITHNELDNEEEHLFFPKEIRRKRHLTTNDDEQEELEEEKDFHTDIDGEGYDSLHATTSSHGNNVDVNNDHNVIASDNRISPPKMASNSVNRIECDNDNVQNASTSFLNKTTTSVTPKSRNNGNAKGTSWLATQPKLNAKSKSGYILFSAEVRKRVMNENPDAGFGEVSKIVGIEWKRLSDEQKRQYEKRAQYIAEERAKAELLTPNSKIPQPGQTRVHCCRWQQCDFQFDCQEGLFEHIRTTHTLQLENTDGQYACLWNSCLKYRKEGKPFPSLPRLHRHLKEKHLTSAIRLMYSNQIAKNYFVYSQSQNPKPTTSNSGGGSTSVKGINIENGHFVHHPYGEISSNAPSCTSATPTVSSQFVNVSTATTQHQGHSTGQHHTALTAALGPSNISTPVRYMSSPTGTVHKPGYSSTLLNGVLPSTSQTNTTGTTATHHYVVQQQQTPHHSRQQQINHQQLNQPSHQTVVIPAGQQAIVVNGVTVYIPANAQTIILPPYYTGSQQHHQIIVHTQPQQISSQHPQSMANGPLVQQSHQYINAPFPQQKHPQQQISIQNSTQSTAAALHTSQQQHNMANGMSISNINGPQTAAQFMNTSNSSTFHINSSQQLAGQQQSATPVVPIHPTPKLNQQASTTSQPTVSQTTQYQNLPQAHSQPQSFIDPGRTVVTAQKPLEPAFVAQSKSINIKRVMHSETYVKYLESMYNNSTQNQTISKWDKTIQASHKNTAVQRKLPYEWIQSANGSKTKEDEIVNAFWQLRNQLIEGTTNVCMPSCSVIESAPQPPGFDEAGPSTSSGIHSNNGGNTEDRRKGS